MALHLYLDLMTAAYGLWLMVPLNTFAGGTIYRGMSALPEWAWGLLMAAPALTSLFLRWRGFASTTLMIGGAMWWSYWLLLSVQINPATGGIVLFGGPALGYLWCWLCATVWGRRWTK